MRFTVRAPASSANLGPGFDAVGLALDLWNTLTVDTDPGAIDGARPRPAASDPAITGHPDDAVPRVVAVGTGRLGTGRVGSGSPGTARHGTEPIDPDHADDDWDVVVAPATGRDAGMLDGRENLAVKAMRLVAADHGRSLPPCLLIPHNGVPIARGLGSSAAALVAGLVAADRLLGLGLSRKDLFRYAWEMEGHGDNVGAALYGGAILAVPGAPEPVCLCPGDGLGLVAVVFISEATGATWAARAALPQMLPYAAAVHNIAAAAGLVAGLLTRDTALLGASMRDRIHEPYRARLFPHLAPMAEAALEAGAAGACLSGAGPTVLALVAPEVAPSVAGALSEVASRLAVGGEVATLEPVGHGAHVEQG